MTDQPKHSVLPPAADLLARTHMDGVDEATWLDVIQRMELTSKQWLLDPEIMIKAHYMGVRVLEYNCFARMRGNGLSHVKATTCWEFFAALLRFRFSGEFSDWRRRVGSAPKLVAPEAPRAALAAG